MLFNQDVNGNRFTQTSTIETNVIPPGSWYGDRFNQFDRRLTKIFRTGAGYLVPQVTMAARQGHPLLSLAAGRLERPALTLLHGWTSLPEAIRSFGVFGSSQWPQTRRDSCHIS